MTMTITEKYRKGLITLEVYLYEMWELSAGDDSRFIDAVNHILSSKDLKIAAPIIKKFRGEREKKFWESKFGIMRKREIKRLLKEDI